VVRAGLVAGHVLFEAEAGGAAGERACKRLLVVFCVLAMDAVSWLKGCAGVEGAVGDYRSSQCRGNCFLQSPHSKAFFLGQLNVPDAVALWEIEAGVCGPAATC
jgi:hypothetical protein